MTGDSMNDILTISPDKTAVRRISGLRQFSVTFYMASHPNFREPFSKPMNGQVARAPESFSISKGTPPELDSKIDQEHDPDIFSLSSTVFSTLSPWLFALAFLKVSF
jgi:hypothetical protein